MLAIALAITGFPDRKLHILTDSQRAIACLEMERPELITRCDGEVLAIVEDIRHRLRGREVRISWVKGHSGHPLNEIADRLAVSVRRSHEADVPESTQRAIADNIVESLCRALRRMKRGIMTEWTSTYLDLGFRGPDPSGRMEAEINGLELMASYTPGNLVSVIATWSTEHTMGYLEMTCSATWDARHVLNTIGQNVDEVGMSHALEELRLRFGITLRDAEQMTERSMTAGNFGRFTVDTLPKVPSATYGLEETLEYRAAVRCARESRDGILVGWIATDHPCHDVRGAALQNAACPDSARLQVAAEGDAAWILLQDRELPAPIFKRMVKSEAVRYLESERPELHHDLLLAMALHPTCPENLVPGLVAHTAQRRGQRRIHVAQQAWSAAPDRRDLIHTLLLQKSRPGRSTNQLLAAVLGPDTTQHSARIIWIQQHGDSRVRRFAPVSTC
ncbi:RNase H family protein [Rhodococcus sp. WB9]|uniref:RNase H family protein n=1 Tax=Rhodococcus sp. WB9 TaxID=2594007 RepID=UPI0016431581|nr:RNase H family protein [Rhodococcus sp. WB9]